MTNPGSPARTNPDLKKRIRELEEENCQLGLRLARAGKHLNRLRMERAILLERLEQVDPLAKADPLTTATGNEP